MPLTDYQLRECIGKGNFGDVYKARNYKNKLVAIKIMNMDSNEDNIASSIQEIQLLSLYKCVNITQFIESFVLGYTLWIVMEYCGAGSCSDLLKYHKKLDEDSVSYIIQGTLNGLAYLHSCNIIHRDIKSANILLTTDAIVKLADFGVSGEMTFTHVKRKTFVGTPYWMAPEVIKNKGYNEKADVWSIGITTIELLSGSPPLSNLDPFKALFDIPKLKPPSLTGVNYSENAKDFVSHCLQMDPSNRYPAKRLLHHKFLKGDRKGALLQRLIQEKLIYEKEHKPIKKPRHTVAHKMIRQEIKGSKIDINESQVNWDFDTHKSFKLLNDSPDMDLLGLSHSIEMNPDMNTETNPTSAPMSPLDLACDVFVKALENVEKRAYSNITKRAVAELTIAVVQVELNNPGLCEALLQELERIANSLALLVRGRDNP